MSRSQLHKTVSLAIGFAATACTQQQGGTLPRRSQSQKHQSQAAVRSLVSPSSPGWQAQARTLVGANNMSPLAAARVYAALSVAQYRAVMAADDSDDGGQSPRMVSGAAGAARSKHSRGAVAGSSAQVLSFFFPAAAAALEQRVVMEGETGPGGVHPHFTRGVAIGRTRATRS